MIKPKPKNQDAVQLIKTQSEDCILLFTTYENKKTAEILKNNVLIRVFVQKNGLPKDTICIGKISELKEEIGCAFLMLPGKQKCFIQLSELKEEYNLTRPGQKCKCGDSFVVKISKEPSKNKLASAITTLKPEEEPYRQIASSRTDYSILKNGNNYIEEALSYFDVLTDRVNTSTCRIITDDEEVYNFLTGPENSDRFRYEIQKYEDNLVKLNVLYGLKDKISEALSRHVWLKSGADIFIDRTEALTVIDVNSGKKSGKEDPDQTYLSINKEAACEICRQIVLRNLSGIILIDFINMKNDESKQELTAFMSDLCKTNDHKMHIIDITKLGIMETTRQKTGPSLFELFDS